MKTILTFSSLMRKIHILDTIPGSGLKFAASLANILPKTRGKFHKHCQEFRFLPVELNGYQNYCMARSLSKNQKKRIKNGYILIIQIII